MSVVPALLIRVELHGSPQLSLYAPRWEDEQALRRWLARGAPMLDAVLAVKLDLLRTLIDEEDAA